MKVVVPSRLEFHLFSLIAVTNCAQYNSKQMMSTYCIRGFVSNNAMNLGKLLPQCGILFWVELVRDTNDNILVKLERLGV